MLFMVGVGKVVRVKCWFVLVFILDWFEIFIFFVCCECFVCFVSYLYSLWNVNFKVVNSFFNFVKCDVFVCI